MHALEKISVYVFTVYFTLVVLGPEVIITMLEGDIVKHEHWLLLKDPVRDLRMKYF